MAHRYRHEGQGATVVGVLLVGLWSASALSVQAEETNPAHHWRYEAMVDVSYAADFNHPDNDLWRSKTTTRRVNRLAPNLILGSVSKEPTTDSRWGLEFGVQGGYDVNALAPAPGGDRPVEGAESLRHFSRANVAYLAPVGNGLTLRAGLFQSYIGYQSFYAKNNLNYTRSYMADHAPYFLAGLSADYAVSARVDVGLYVVNGYNYLAHPNDQPSYGAQIRYRPAAGWTLTQNLYAGPDQSNTAFRYWRTFSDSIVEWKRDRVVLALSYDVGTEQAAERPGHPRMLWMGGAGFARWQLEGPWAVAVRPEFYWDRNGRITGAEQLLKAVTGTLEYRLRDAWQTTVLRVEYRYDESTGVGGGFFSGPVITGPAGLARERHLLLFALIWAFEAASRT